jgi:membrane protease YdiL (CAAX protease family)
MTLPEQEPYTGPPPTRPVGNPPVYPTYGMPAYGPRGYGPPGYAVPAYPPYAAPPYAPQAYPAAYPGGWPAAPAVRWEPPPGTPPHDVPRPFLQAMLSRDWRWWRPLLGLFLFAVVFTVADILVLLLALLTTLSPDLALDDLIAPATLLITNLTLIVAIPTVWLAWAVAHGMRTGWSSSVLGRVRWRLFAPLTGRALATLGVGIALTVLVGVLADPGSVTGPVPGYGWLLVVVFLTTPLQSAAEEYVFRGYLSQTIAGWIKAPRAGAITAAVVTATLFSLAHVPPDFLTFLDRFVFGLAASAVVWLTGGLEGAIVLHAVNNVLVFTLAGALGEAVATDDVTGPGLLLVLVDVLAMAAYVAVVARSRRKLRPETATAALDLRPAALPGPPLPATPWGR